MTRSNFLDFEKQVITHLSEQSYPILLFTLNEDYTRHCTAMIDLCSTTLTQLKQSGDQIQANIASLESIKNVANEFIAKFYTPFFNRFVVEIKDAVAKFFIHSKATTQKVVANMPSKEEIFSLKALDSNSAKRNAINCGIYEGKRAVDLLSMQLIQTICNLASELKLINAKYMAEYASDLVVNMNSLLTQLSTQHGIANLICKTEIVPKNVVDAIISSVTQLTSIDFKAVSSNLEKLVTSGVEQVNEPKQELVDVNYVVSVPEVTSKRAGGFWGYFGLKESSVSYRSETRTMKLPSVKLTAVEYGVFKIQSADVYLEVQKLLFEQLNMAESNVQQNLQSLLVDGIGLMWEQALTSSLTNAINSANIALESKKKDADGQAEQEQFLQTTLNFYNNNK